MRALSTSTLFVDDMHVAKKRHGSLQRVILAVSVLTLGGAGLIVGFIAVRLLNSDMCSAGIALLKKELDAKGLPYKLEFAPFAVLTDQCPVLVSTLIVSFWLMHRVVVPGVAAP